MDRTLNTLKTGNAETLNEECKSLLIENARIRQLTGLMKEQVELRDTMKKYAMEIRGLPASRKPKADKKDTKVQAERSQLYPLLDKKDKHQSVDPCPPPDKKEKQQNVDPCPPPDPKNLKKCQQIDGEIAFQLDRRILCTVFLDQRHYGYRVADIKEKIKQVSCLHTGEVNGELRSELIQRYRNIMDQLKKLGYDQKVHPYLTEHLVNTHGIMKESRTTGSEDITAMNNQQYVRKILEEYPGSDKLDILIIFKCLAHLAERDGKPMFIWK